MMLMDIHFGTSFFDAGGVGIRCCPACVLVLRSSRGLHHDFAGLRHISQIIPAFARKRLFGYASMVYATASIAILSFLVWRTTCSRSVFRWPGELFFMYATMLIAVPTGVKVFNWVATMFRGSMTFETPMLFALAFVVLFTIGGFSGLMLAIAPVDFQYHDTYFVVAHFHYVLVPGAVFAIMAGVYYWLPKWTGHMLDERMGRSLLAELHCVNITFFPMHFIGLAGMHAAYRITHCSLPTSIWWPRWVPFCLACHS